MIVYMVVGCPTSKPTAHIVSPLSITTTRPYAIPSCITHGTGPAISPMSLQVDATNVGSEAPQNSTSEFQCTNWRMFPKGTWQGRTCRSNQRRPQKSSKHNSQKCFLQWAQLPLTQENRVTGLDVTQNPAHNIKANCT